MFSCSVTCCSLPPHGLCSPPVSSVHGISQAKNLEWVAISFSGGSFRPRDWIHVSCISCIGRQILCHWATWKAFMSHHSSRYKELFHGPPLSPVLYLFSLPLHKPGKHWSFLIGFKKKTKKTLPYAFQFPDIFSWLDNSFFLNSWISFHWMDIP